MKKIYTTAALIVMTILCAKAQNDLKEKIEKENVVKGYIVEKKDTIPGYFKKMGHAYADGKSYHAGWEFQGDVKFVDEKTFKKEDKVKNKHYEKYRPKDLKAYGYDTLVYESVKYSDLGSIGIGALAGNKFLRKVVDGKVNVYEHYGTPPPVASGSFAPIYEELQMPDIVYRKKGDKDSAKDINQLNVKKELADCAALVERYENNEFGAFGKEGEKAKGVNKLLNQTDGRRVKLRLTVIDAYNESCE